MQTYLDLTINNNVELRDDVALGDELDIGPVIR
jgi:hypothetical protein